MNLLLQVGVNRSGIGKEMHDIAARRNQKKVTGGNGRVIQGRR